MAAALSMTCGVCNAQLRSVQEAREHAEMSGHTDFAESTEPVLNLVCRICGKPCRTKTECELHTKRTGHDEFDDKTDETAKPISVDSIEHVEEGGSASTGLDAELIVPEVNKQLLEELESMGFPHGRAIRALHFSGSSSVEAAINWIVEHENDADVDEVPMVPATKNSVHHNYTPEEAKAKMLELRERARKKKEEEERRMEREREKERIRIGKELLEAKRIEEDNERKRLIMLRKAEKEEEQRAREKIRLKLEEDKAERRRKLGLPPEDNTKAQPSPQVVEEKKSFLPVRPASKAEKMRECLRSLKQNNKDDEARVKKAFQTLLTYVGNVVRSPDEEKFRKIRISNSAFQERVGSFKEGIQFFEICGFEKDDEFLILPRDKVDVVVLNTAGAELNSAIVNPFFGVL